MKRSVITNTLLVLLCGIVLFGIFYLNDPDAFSIKREEKTAEEPMMDIIRYPVVRGEVESTETVSGRVISGRSDIYIEVFSFETGKLELSVSKGDEIEKGDLLYNYLGEDVVAEFCGKVTDIACDGEHTALSLLNYGKLYAEVELDAELLREIGYGTKVFIEADGERRETEIKSIGYEIRNGKIGVEINIPDGILPGSEIKATFILGTRPDALYIHADAIFEIQGRYYAMLEVGKDTYERVEVEVGEYFEVKEGGNVFPYFQILSGLSQGDTVVLEMMREYADIEGALP